MSDAVTKSRHELLSRLAAARAETDALFTSVKPDALYDRPIPERHRIVFYIGHLEAFDWNLLRDSGAPADVASDMDRLFAFGIDPVDGNLPSDVPHDWPRLPVVFQYRDQTRRAVDNVLESETVTEQKLNIAIEHRLMHAETLSYILHQLPFDRKQGSSAVDAMTGPSFPELFHESIRIPAGVATLGLPRDTPDFGWDNEFDQLVSHVPEFTIDKYKVTNAQFLRFLNEGGYQDRSLWAPADWAWRSSQDISHPIFWTPRADAWHYLSMFEEIPLPPASPVYVSHAEASAYAKWAGKVLPTEAQWHRAAQSEFGVEGLIATGWEWTSTEFAPFPGFQPMPSYPGYSAPFFDGKHYVLKGGSPCTAPVMLRPSFRNWFQPHYQYVYAGFRCAEQES